MGAYRDPTEVGMYVYCMYEYKLCICDVEKFYVLCEVVIVFLLCTKVLLIIHPVFLSFLL